MPFFTCKDAQGNVVPGKEKVQFAAQPPNPQGKGWTWEAWVAEQAPPEPATVPPEVTNFQMRAALRGAGVLQQVAAFVADLGDDVAIDAWEYANFISRSGALVAAAKATLGWSDEQVDQLFIAAAAIEA
jgi:hypothetical protein